jgi:hypothetical protein
VTLYGNAVYQIHLNLTDYAELRMHTVIETPDFIRDAADSGLSGDEVAKIVSCVSVDPSAGDLMAGTGGARKVRFAGRGKGKSGGYRVVTYFCGDDDVPVFLLGVFGKGEKDNLTKAERNELRKELAALAEDYRASTTSKVAEIKRRARNRS